MTGFNVGCIDEIDVFKFENVQTNDGLNHPLDKKNKMKLGGFYSSDFKRKYLNFLKKKKVEANLS